MITIKFFAQIKELTGCAQHQLNISKPTAVNDIKLQLVDSDKKWQCLSEQDVLVAVNQTLATPETIISDGDEVAFFPPVTGG